MPLLDTTPVQPTQAQLAAMRRATVNEKTRILKSVPRAMFTQLLASWRKGIEMIWDDPNPAEIVAALGTDAVELFTRSAQLGQFLESQKPGCTAEIIAKVGSFTPNADGSISVP